MKVSLIRGWKQAYWCKKSMGVDSLSHFNPEKLFLEFNGVTIEGPVIPRRYTLTHSDSTGNLFLTIGTHYAWNKINPLRDEVLGEWKLVEKYLCFYVYVYIDQGEYKQHISVKRNEIFRRELPLALTAIRYGDRCLFDTHPHLDDASIIINFMSVFPQLAKQENWGNFRRFSILV